MMGSGSLVVDGKGVVLTSVGGAPAAQRGLAS